MGCCGDAMPSPIGKAVLRFCVAHGCSRDGSLGHEARRGPAFNDLPVRHEQRATATHNRRLQDICQFFLWQIPIELDKILCICLQELVGGWKPRQGHAGRRCCVSLPQAVFSKRMAIKPSRKRLHGLGSKGIEMRRVWTTKLAALACALVADVLL